MPHARPPMQLADEEYHALALLVGERAGICLGATVREAVCCRALQQMAEQGCRRFSDYLACLRGDGAAPLLSDLCAPLRCHPPLLFSISPARCRA